jgi:hypothetical protein
LFGLEAEMIPVIEAHLNRVLGHPKTLAQANELPVNNRVVDVAAAVVDTEEMESVTLCPSSTLVGGLFTTLLPFIRCTSASSLTTA